MSFFIVAGDRYEPVKLREDEYEGFIDLFWDHLVPEWHYMRWKPLLRSISGRVKPDAVAIRRDYQDWFVVEVELASHPTEHFHSQFQRLSEAEYGRHLLETFEAEENSLDESALTRLLSVRPGLLCIANEATDALVGECREFGFEFMKMSPYHSRLGHYAAQVGRFPTCLRQEISATRFSVRVGGESWGGRLRGELPRNFPFGPGFDVLFEGSRISLRVMTIENDRYVLIPREFATGTSGLLTLSPIDPVNRLYSLSTLIEG